MTQNISPGVYTVENDLSQYISNLSSTIVAMVGTAEFGPSETPTLITSPSQFVSIFGQQNPKHYLGYAVNAYLAQGNTVYVSRVAPSDATSAEMTMVLPTVATPYAGQWTLASNTQTSATFTVQDSSSLATGSTSKTIKLDPNTLIPGFDFTDTTGLLPANGKLGSDLHSFVGNATATASYINGSTFTINTGAGKSSGSTITGLGVDAFGNPQLTVNATKFNSFNSPLTSTAVGQLGLVSTTPLTPNDTPAALPIVGTSLATIGAINYNSISPAPGVIELVYDVVGTDYTGDAAVLGSNAQELSALLAGGTTSAAVLTALNNLVTVNGTTSVKIAVPLSPTSIAASLILIQGILSSLIAVLVSTPASSLAIYPNLAAAYLLIRAQSASGLIGLGSIDTNGNSAGLKASALVLNAANLPVAINLYALTTGASGNWHYAVNPAVVSVINHMTITGTFSTNIFRPTWKMSAAGSSIVPTFLKFSSIGEGDFSDIAITLTFLPGDLDGNQNQNYTVRLFQRQSSANIAAGSVNYGDFSLIETYYGIPDSLMSAINSASQTVSLKIDYTTTDTASLTSGTVVAGLPSDYLTLDPVLNTDPSGKGVIQGLNYSLQNSTFAQQFGMLLLGGSAGSLITGYDILGSSASKTGIYAFVDPEKIDINLIIAPGWSADPIVADGLIGLCSSRGDCMTILDTPFALDVQGVINYRNNILNANTSYAAVYYPWVKIADSVNQTNIFVPPSGLVAAQYAYNDLVGQIFTAPAGRNRGNLIAAIATERILNQGDRDMLTLAQINPIYTEAGYGTYIRGQMTLQSTATALDRVNVRRLLLYLRKVIATASKYYEFEPADSITALRLKQIATSLLQSYVASGGIVSFTVDVGPDVNTALTLDNNELYMSISLVPTKTAEVIVEIFNILGQQQGISIAST